MKKMTVLQLCLLALAAGLNTVGASIALALRLPIYLDTLGTMLAAALFGPFWAMVPGLISGLFCGITSDIYALYYIPVQLITGFAAGLVFKRFTPKGWKILPASLFVSLPGTADSASVTALLFGGITSSGSTLLVQLLHGMGANLTLSVFLVQAATDYADRAIVMAAALAVLPLLPGSVKYLLQKGDGHRGTL